MKIFLAKSGFIILLLFVWSNGVCAQAECALPSKTAPLLLNLRIGMTPQEVQSVFGSALRIKVKKNGERTIFQNYIKSPAPQSLNGVRAIYLRFYDKKLYQSEIFYEPRTDLKSIEEISGALAVQLNFPAAQWEIKNKQAEIHCDNFSIIADYILNPRIEITDEATRARIEKSRKKK